MRNGKASFFTSQAVRLGKFHKHEHSGLKEGLTSAELHADRPAHTKPGFHFNGPEVTHMNVVKVPTLLPAPAAGQGKYL